MKNTHWLRSTVLFVLLLCPALLANAQSNPALTIFRAWGLTFPTEPNSYYLLQSSTNLSNWTNLNHLVEGTGTNVTVYEPDSSHPNQFFRTVNLGQFTNGLVAYYRMNGDGTDGSGFANTGVLGGSATASTNRLGETNAALVFSGANAPFTASNAPQLQITGTLSVAVWFNADSGGVGLAPRLVEKGEQFTLAMVGTGTQRQLGFGIVRAGGYQEVSTGQSFPIGIWHHAVAVYNGSTIRIFVNGQLAASAPSSGALAVSAFDLTCGYNIKNSLDKFKGAIDEVRIYNRALTDAEVSGLYLLNR